MKAITVRQPWAWAITVGAKRVENRQAGFPRKYRGPLAVHAGKGLSSRGLVDERIADLARLHGVPLDPPLFPVGAIVAVADLVDVHPAAHECCASPEEAAPWGPDCYPWGETSYTINGGGTVTSVAHLVLESIEPLAEPVPCRGALGLWTPPPHILAYLSA